MLGAVIGAGGAILGGMLGSKSAEKQQQKAMDWQSQSIQTRVADAKAAGIHPLAALGSTYQNQMPLSDTANIIADSMTGAGQALGKGLNAKRIRHAQETKHFADVNKTRAETALLVAQTQAINSRANSTPDRFGQAIDPNHPLFDKQSGQYVIRGPEGGKILVPPLMTGAQDVADISGEAAELLVAANLAKHLADRGPGIGYHKKTGKWVPVPRMRPRVASDFYIGGP